MKEFVEKLIGRLEEYKYSHLVERDLERFEHCKENEKHCEGNDCFWCVWDKAKQIVNELAEEYEKKKILCEITLNGCDDDTCFNFKMTEQEYEFIKKVSEKANETSAYTCMPIMYVEKLGLFQKEGKKNWKI